MKKLLSMIILLVLTIGMVPTVVQAKEDDSKKLKNYQNKEIVDTSHDVVVRY